MPLHAIQEGAANVNFGCVFCWALAEAKEPGDRFAALGAPGRKNQVLCDREAGDELGSLWPELLIRSSPKPYWIDLSFPIPSILYTSLIL